MQKKKNDVCYCGTIISIQQEAHICDKLFILIMNKNDYYTKLEQHAQMYGKKAAIATYGLSAAISLATGCSLNHILYFVYNNPHLYSCIEFVVKTKEELERSKEELQAAIRLANMEIKSIY